MKRRYWDLMPESMARNYGAPNLPRLYEMYGRPALVSAAGDPMMAEKIAIKAAEILEFRPEHQRRPYRGLRLYVFLSGMAAGAMHAMFAPVGMDALDEDGTHTPTVMIAAACKVAIEQGMLEPAAESVDAA